MSIDSRIAALKQDIVEHLAVLDRTERYADEYFARFGPGPRTAADAFLVTGVLSNYYTCLETVFLRISEYFENSLAPARWHKDLLEKMTLSIEGVRPRLLAEDTVLPLQELLRFRHFCRYYFAFEYDWDRLEFALKKFAQARPLVRRDLAAFLAFLNQLAEASSAEDR